MVSRMDMARMAARYDTSMAAAFRRALGICAALARAEAAAARLLGRRRSCIREAVAMEGIEEAMRNGDDPVSWHIARTRGR